MTSSPLLSAILQTEPIGGEITGSVANQAAEALQSTQEETFTVLGSVKAFFMGIIGYLTSPTFIANAVATVIVVAATFWRLGDRRYALLSLIVLAILGTSVALALNR